LHRGGPRSAFPFVACEDRSDEDGHALFIGDPVKLSGVDVISKTWTAAESGQMEFYEFPNTVHSETNR